VDPDWEALQRAIAGRVVLPGSADYESVRKPFLRQFDHLHPRAVVLCERADDVVEALSLVVGAELRIAARSGGHCFAGRSSSEGVVIDVTPMNAVSVSGDVATIGAGARLGDVYGSLNEHGLTIPAGSCPSVGIVGLTLGGGLGIRGRRYGVTSDRLIGARIVLADGRIVDCDDEHHRELFWALRGAGSGNFGVVTSLVFRTIPASTATNFHLTWAYSDAAAVIEAWQGWAPIAPDELYASLLVRAGDEPEQPPLVDLVGSMLGSEQETGELLDELVVSAGADLTSGFRQHMSFEETTRFWEAPAAADAAEQGESQQDVSLFFKSEFFRRPLPPEAVAALLTNLTDGRVRGESRELDFTPWGGAYNRTAEDATAFAHRGELFSLKHTAIVDSDSSKLSSVQPGSWLMKSWMTARPWGSGRVFPNFPDPDLDDWGHAYYGRNYERLLRIKERFDPDNVFRFHQSL
jgi:FAD/FMN-containing dehydrogenase